MGKTKSLQKMKVPSSVSETRRMRIAHQSSNGIEEELCTLSGIGESRADAVIEYREKNGGFSKIEDIMNVEGIKEGMFSRLKDKICVK